MYSEKINGTIVHYDNHGYEVTHNFNIHIPRDTDLRLRSVNDGIKTEQTSGKFDIAGVNGPIYTDFDTTLPAKVDRHSSVRIGSGGPELKFETVNGEIRIKKESSK